MAVGSLKHSTVPGWQVLLLGLAVAIPLGLLGIWSSPQPKAVPVTTDTYIEVPLKDGDYPIMESPPIGLVREFLRDYPDQELVRMGTLLVLHVENGKAQVRLNIRLQQK